MTTNKPEVEGMETTAAEREQWTRHGIAVAGFRDRLIRDLDRALAEIARLRRRIADAEAEKAEAVDALEKDERLHQTGLLFADVEFIDEVERTRRAVLAKNGITIDTIRARGEART